MINQVFQYYTMPILYLGCMYFIDTPIVMLWVIYTLVPCIDEFLTMDTYNPTTQQSKDLEQSIKFKLPLYLSVLLDWVFMVYVLNHLTTTYIPILNVIALIYLWGGISSTLFTVTHELLHKDEYFEKTLGTLGMAKNLYMHYSIEHVWGHHRLVATPLDPASAPQGQSLPSFIKFTIPAQFQAAWKHESRRSFPNNRMIWYSLNNIIFPLVICYIYGILGMVYFILHAIQSIAYLEASNYIEHYGLRRKVISPGVYEPIDATISWNSPFRLVNYLLFKLQRHSDHHENPYKPYQNLVIDEQSPLLPCSYLVAVMLAFFPSVWFDIMDPVVNNWNQNHKNNALIVARQKVQDFLKKFSIVLSGLLVIQLIY